MNLKSLTRFIPLTIKKPLITVMDTGLRFYLERRHPLLRGFSVHKDSIRQHYAPLHETYTSEISSRGWAVSFETGVLLSYLCQQRKPKVIFDLGSGFSSLIFHDYARDSEVPCQVYSVDDNESWLNTTRDYLHRNGHEPPHLIQWDEFAEQVMPHIEADLIFLDLGWERVTREEALHLLLPRLKSSTLLLLDDMQFPALKAEFQKTVGHRYISLIAFTRDEIGRFSGMVLWD